MDTNKLVQTINATLVSVLVGRVLAKTNSGRSLDETQRADLAVSATRTAATALSQS